MKEVPLPIGTKIKKMRAVRKISQMSLAVAAGIDYNTLRKIESNKVPNPRFNTMCAIASALGVDVHCFDQTPRETTFSTYNGVPAGKQDDVKTLGRLVK